MAQDKRGGSGRGGSGRDGRRKGSKSGGRSRSSRPPTKRHYPRTVRLNSLLQQIVADYLLRVDDERLGFLTVTGVEVDSDLNKAEVFVSSLDGPLRAANLDSPGRSDEDADSDYLEALADYRIAIQAEIATQARLRKTPEVVFAFDDGVRSGARIESILATIDDEPVPEPDPETYKFDSDENVEADADIDAQLDVDDPLAEGS